MVTDSLAYLDSRLRGNDDFALTLLVAESDPKHKETLILLIMNMLAIHQDRANG